MIGMIYKFRPVFINRLCKMYNRLNFVLNLFMVSMYGEQPTCDSHSSHSCLTKKAVRSMIGDNQFPQNPGTLPTSLFAKLELYLGNRYLYLYTNVWTLQGDDHAKLAYFLYFILIILVILRNLAIWSCFRNYSIMIRSCFNRG